MQKFEPPVFLVLNTLHLESTAEMSLLSRFAIDQGLPTDADGRRAAMRPSGLEEGEPEGGTNQSNIPGRGSSLSPPATPLRRSRAESLEAEAERVAKCRKQFAARVCKEKGLAEDSLEAFAVMDMAEMAITMHAELLVRKREQEKTDAHQYISSEEFKHYFTKDILKDRLRSCLLSPNLTAYIIDLALNVFAYAKKNLTTFKIPPTTIEDPEMSDHIHMLIKEILTSQCSNIKQKISNSINYKLHVSVLARSLAPAGFYEITTSHWSRFSFLRASMTTFDTIVEECAARASQRKKAKRTHRRHASAASPEAPAEEEEAARDGDSRDGDESRTTGNEDAVDGNGDNRTWATADFWEYVDCLLADLRAAAVKQEQTTEGRQKYLEA
ncbi:hypothetical protein PAXINDRAFT_12305 [Paxillus involutus ATCC 200175]|uniref:Uncharacterized protein n=1 Tax=Paxillus involutus ATCC 200175 TaxID=664439 RepID=A0A0C9SYH5_PAXIN|nr:hypothetical protein PAXINDRAFT_12305 [Paxillus involutus ATCC 200175]